MTGQCQRFCSIIPIAERGERNSGKEGAGADEGAGSSAWYMIPTFGIEVASSQNLVYYLVHVIQGV